MVTNLFYFIFSCFFIGIAKTCVECLLFRRVTTILKGQKASVLVQFIWLCSGILILKQKCFSHQCPFLLDCTSLSVYWNEANTVMAFDRFVHSIMHNLVLNTVQNGISIQGQRYFVEVSYNINNYCFRERRFQYSNTEDFLISTSNSRIRFSLSLC